MLNNPSAARADSLYQHASGQELVQRVRRLFGKQPGPLFGVQAVLEHRHVIAQDEQGIHTVKLEQVRGTASGHRTLDFDECFMPRNAHLRDRWVSVAQAVFDQKALPPIKLLKVGQSYYVIDGHHRVSVAKALGQDEIRADVLEWRTA